MADKTWYAEPNLATTDASSVANALRNALWLIKAILVGNVGAVTQGRWSVVGSSDGVTAGLDAVDRWGAAFDVTKLVRAVGAVAHSWMVLKSPDALGPYYLLIDYSGAADREAAFNFSSVAFTGGTITVAPTSTRPQTMTLAFCDDVAAIQKASRVADIDGNFWLFLGQQGTGKCQFLLGCQTLMDAHAADTHKVAGCFQFDETTGILMAAYNGTWAGNAISTTSPAFRMRSANGGVGLNEVGAVVPVVGAGAPSFLFAGTEMVTVDAADGSYGFFPTYVYSMTLTYKSLRGRLPDVGWAPANTGTGMLSPVGAPTNVCIGGSWFPWSGSVAPSF